MAKTRVMVLCLDAFDPVLSDQLMAQGKLAGLARLKAESARFELEHGPQGQARYTGLAWEHFSSGCKPETVEKWSAVSFDPVTFEVRQSHATERPFLADVAAKCVVFDPPYFDLQAMPNGVGAVGWAGHDTGVHPHAQPAGLMDEIIGRFGPPSDVHTLNATAYACAETTVRVAEMIRASVRQRVDIAEWLFSEREPEWDVAVLGFAEPHDSIELFYHGVDPDHHLADRPSVAAARDGLIGVYEEISAQIERLMDRFPDVAFVVFSMHGMGKNDTDIPTMLLLPELMHRMTFGQPLFRSRPDWQASRTPLLEAGECWHEAVIAAMRHKLSHRLMALPSRVRLKAGKIARRLVGLAPSQIDVDPLAERSFNCDWMPATQYARYWTRMDAFGLPAYFDGRIRVNLRGRERHGRAPLSRYDEILDEIEATLRACVDTKTGEPVVREISRPRRADPRDMGQTEADMTVIWNGSPVGFRHPVHGDIGPGPIRRAGGHSGGHGALYVRAPDLEAGDYGVRSSFDVAAAIIDLMEAVRPNRLDGVSALDGLRPRQAPAPAFAPRRVRRSSVRAERVSNETPANMTRCPVPG